MFELLRSAAEELGDLNIKWCFSGGWAIDLFLGNKSRPHKDLDIMIFKNDIKAAVSYLSERDWRIEAPTRQGFLPVNAENFDTFEYDNLWCMNEKYPMDYLKVDEQGSCNFYHYERDIQEQVDYIEILLNTFEEGCFVYAKNPAIRLDIDKAISKFEGLPYLAPEIVLLYKSKYLSEDNISDFEMVTEKMNAEQREWLKVALSTEYGADHPWVEALM